MSLIRVGSFEDLSLAPLPTSDFTQPLAEGASSGPSAGFGDDISKVKRSEDERALALSGIRLHRGFEGIRNIFNPRNQIYFVAWAWDLSGNPVTFYPEQEVDPQTLIIPLVRDEERQMIGDGILLFPKRQVAGGIHVRVQIWESDQKEREFGKRMKKVAKKVKASKLNNLLGLVATAGGITTTTVSLVTNASLELAGLVGEILSQNRNDYVDLFEGTFAADRPWEDTEHHYDSSNAGISIRTW